MKSRCLALAIAVGLLIVPGVSRAAGVSVSASLDRGELEVGGRALLSIEVSGSTDAQVPDLGRLPGFTASYIGPSTQISIIQGKVSRTITYRYRLTAEKPGRFTLGPFRVEVRGRVYRTAPVSVVVRRHPVARPRAGNALRGNKDLFVELSIPKSKAYLHERVPLEVTLYAGAVRVDDIQYPMMAGKGFTQEAFGKPVRAERLVGGRSYQTMIFHTTFVPEQSGRITIGPAVMKMNIMVRRRSWDDLFNDFWRFDPFGQERPIELRSEAHELLVVPLPQRGRPASFSGAVGRFDFALEAEPRELRAGDPVTVTYTIKGEGNLAGIRPPQIEGDGFKTYPTREVREESQSGKSVFEQVVIPNSGKVTRIPPVPFSYFDPQAGRYKTLVSQPVTLTVLPGRKPGMEARRGGGAVAGKEEVVGEDIVYIKDSPGRLRPVGWRLYRTRWFWGVQIFPLLLFLSLLAVSRRRQRLRGDPRYARYVRAGRRARRRLRRAARLIGERDGVLYDELGLTVREYLSAKLDLPPGAIEPERVAPYVGGSDSAVVSNLKDLLALIEQVRYGKQLDDPDSERKALELARALVRELEGNRQVRRRITTAGGVALLLLVLCQFAPAAVLAAGGGVAEASFFAGNSAYHAGDYKQAARSYRAVLESGFESAAVHYNLGNAYFKLGRLGKAIASYERARRLSPRDPDVEANLEFARSRLKAAGSLMPLVPLWRRLLFPLAFVASATELIWAASSIYLALMAILIARLFVVRLARPLARASVVLSLLLLLVAASAAERVRAEDFWPRAVVVGVPAVSVRFEPSADGTVHFRAPQGMMLSVVRRRGAWLKVERPDGKRGWLEASAVEMIQRGITGEKRN